MSGEPGAQKMYTYQDTFSLIESNANLINQLEMDNEELRNEARRLEKVWEALKGENKDVGQLLEEITKTKEKFFEDFERELKHDERYSDENKQGEKKYELSKCLSIQNERLKEFNMSFLSTDRLLCISCSNEFYEDENEEETCIMHPGVLRYYDCSNCAFKECYNCCGLCKECSAGCKKTFHIAQPRLSIERL